MQTNKGFTMQLKTNSGEYIALYPKTSKSQVVDWNIGNIRGPYIIELKASDWVNNKQIVDLDGLSANDRVYCVKVLEGTRLEMEKQNKAYSALLVNGVTSLNNQIKFQSSEEITVDLKIQVWWTE